MRERVPLSSAVFIALLLFFSGVDAQLCPANTVQRCMCPGPAPPTNPPTPPPVVATAPPTTSPSVSPTTSPSASQTGAPTGSPTGNPSASPTNAPSVSPTQNPTAAPSASPSASPTGAPSLSPTNAPSTSPTTSPTNAPTGTPTNAPSSSPTNAPSFSPTPDACPPQFECPGQPSIGCVTREINPNPCVDRQMRCETSGNVCDDATMCDQNENEPCLANLGLCLDTQEVCSNDNDCDIGDTSIGCACDDADQTEIDTLCRDPLDGFACPQDLVCTSPDQPPRVSIPCRQDYCRDRTQLSAMSMQYQFVLTECTGGGTCPDMSDLFGVSTCEGGIDHGIQCYDGSLPLPLPVFEPQRNGLFLFDGTPCEVRGQLSGVCWCQSPDSVQVDPTFSGCGQPCVMESMELVVNAGLGFPDGTIGICRYNKTDDLLGPETNIGIDASLECRNLRCTGTVGVLETPQMAVPPPPTPSSQCACPQGALSENEPCEDSGTMRMNDGCNSPMQDEFVSVTSFSDVYCGTSWAHDGSRDTDWYRLDFEIAQQTRVCVRVESELPLVYVFFNVADNCNNVTVPDGEYGCSSGCENLFSANQVLEAAPAGTYALVVLPALCDFFSTIFDGYRCNENRIEYTLRMESDCTDELIGDEFVPTGACCLDTSGAPSNALGCVDNVTEARCQNMKGFPGGGAGTWQVGSMCNQINCNCPSCPFGVTPSENPATCPDTLNDGCNAGVPSTATFNDVDNGDEDFTWCGSTWTDSVMQIRDTDWHWLTALDDELICIDLISTVQMTVFALRLDGGPISPFDGSPSGTCDLSQGFVVSEFGCSAGCSSTERILFRNDLGAGQEYVIFVAPGDCDGSAIDDNADCIALLTQDDYRYTLQIDRQCTICGAQNTKNPDCCHAAPSEGVPGCGNDECCRAVCQIDEQCCTTEWGQACAELAYQQGDLCGCLTSAAFCGSTNDDCNDARLVTDGCTEVCNTNTTDTTSVIMSCAPTSNDVFFAYTTTCTGTLTVDLCDGGTCGPDASNNFDTVLAIYNAPSGATDTCPGTEFACNDDGCTSHSFISTTVTLGQRLLIQVSTYFSFAPGRVGMNIECAGFDCGEADTMLGPLPVNDVPFDTSGFAPGAASGVCGTADFDGSHGPSIWFTVLGDGNTLTATTCSGLATYDTMIAVYCVDCANLATNCVVGNDDDDVCGVSALLSTVSWCSDNGVEYYIRVSGFGGVFGAGGLTVTSDSIGCGPPTFAC